MSFRATALIASVLLLPAAAECQQPYAEATVNGLPGEASPGSFYVLSTRHLFHTIAAPPASMLTLASTRISSDSTTGIPVVMGGLLGGITLGAAARLAGVYDDGTESPWTAALVYGAGVGGGAAFGAILGSREPRLLPTTAVAIAASIPLAFILIEQQGLEPSPYDGLAILIGLAPPIIGAWFTNKVLQ